MADGTRVGGVYIDVDANLGPLNRDLARAKQSSERTGRAMASEFSKAEKKTLSLTKAVTSLGGGLALLGAGFTLASSIGTLAEFSAKMKEVGALTGATAKQFSELEAQARQLGATTAYTASAAADAQGFLARAGYDVNEVLAATPQILTLASAGSLELAKAADIASNVLAGFNLEISDTGRVVDLLAKTANSSNSTVVQLGEALKFAAPSAVAFGISVEQTLAAIGKLQDAGIQGGLAGRGLVSFVGKFVQSKDKISEIIGDYDLASEGLVGVVSKLQDAGITIEQATEIFRAENLDIFTVLSNAVQSGDLDTLEDSLKGSAGYARALASVKIDQLQGDMKALASAAEDVVLEMGERGLTGAMREVVQNATGAFRSLSENMGSVAKAAEVLAFIMAAVLARKGIGTVVTNLVVLQQNLAASTVGMSRMAIAARAAAVAARGMWAAITSPVGLAVITGLAIGLAKVAGEAETASGKVDRLEETLGRLTSTNQKIKADTDQLAVLNDTLTSAIENQEAAIIATTRADIEGVRARIAANKQLQAVYDVQARKQLEAARAALNGGEGRLQRVSSGILGRTDARGRTGDISDADMSLIMSQIERAQDAGQALSASQVKFLDLYSERLELLAKVAAAEAQLSAKSPEEINPKAVLSVDGGGSRSPQIEPEAPAGDNGGLSTDTVHPGEIAALERAHVLRIAQINDERALIEQLERAEEVERRTGDYLSAGLDLIEAKTRAASEVNAEFDASADFAERELADRRAIFELENRILVAASRGDEQKAAALQRELDIIREIARLKELGYTGDLQSQAASRVDSQTFMPDEDAWKEFGDNLEASFKNGIMSAIQTGDWPTALGDILNDVISDQFSNALDSLFDALSQIDWTGNGGTGWGGFVSAIGSSFGGARAGGGQVKKGMAYNVGELGPERFVAPSDGYIVSNEDMTGGASNMQEFSSLNLGGIKVDVHGNLDNVTTDQLAASLAGVMRSIPGEAVKAVANRQLRRAL